MVMPTQKLSNGSAFAPIIADSNGLRHVAPQSDGNHQQDIRTVPYEPDPQQAAALIGDRQRDFEQQEEAQQRAHEQELHQQEIHTEVHHQQHQQQEIPIEAQQQAAEQQEPRQQESGKQDMSEQRIPVHFVNGAH
jgi:hypothetical protein